MNLMEHGSPIRSTRSRGCLSRCPYVWSALAICGGLCYWFGDSIWNFIGYWFCDASEPISTTPPGCLTKREPSPPVSPPPTPPIEKGLFDKVNVPVCIVIVIVAVILCSIMVVVACIFIRSQNTERESHPLGRP